MVKLVGMEWCFLGVVLILWVQAIWLHIGPRRWDRCQDLSLLLRFGKLPSVLLVLNFRASGFPPNRLDRR